MRISGKVGFLIIRDRYGTTQCFLGKEMIEKAKDIRRESVLRVKGEVKERPDNQKKKEQATGEIELSVKELEVLSPADPLPLELDESVASTEETRLKYRYLDLRKPRMQRNLELRSRIIKAIRDYFADNGFIDIETPVLAKSTPEGARDYLVPSRINKGAFYALPQSPQIFKQLSMIACFDKYVQIPKCYRDEDLRADRQPEFTQLDVEMSFIEEEDVFKTIEEMMKRVFKDAMKVDLKTPFPRMTYKEAMERYKSDKPKVGNEKWNFIWIVDFPMFEKNEQGRVTFTHHPFTMPVFDKLEDITSKPLELGSRGYDLVLNGVELGSGSIRIHRNDIQEKVFQAIGLSKEEYEEKFGFFLGALRYGTPPHGGIALGLDRFCALLAGEESIREVVAFPKTKDAEDLMLESPSKVSDEQLSELGLRAGK